MPWYSGFEDILTRDAPLAGRTTFRIGGPADFLLEPRSAEEFAATWAAARQSGLPVHVLGGGSNLLIHDAGVRGVVVATAGMSARGAVRRGEEITAGAGVPLVRLLRFAMKSGLAGLECLVGIPGAVGGAVRMNAGGRYGTIGQRVSAVWCVTASGLVRRPAAEITWGNRFMRPDDPVVAAEFRLRSDSVEAIRWRTRDILAGKARTQPMGARSAGCFFKNPPGDFAGRLIEQAGLKDLRVRAAAVSAKHANFIVNLGHATAADVLSLSGTVRDRVRDRFGIALENEVCCWPQPQN